MIKLNRNSLWNLSQLFIKSIQSWYSIILLKSLFLQTTTPLCCANAFSRTGLFLCPFLWWHLMEVCFLHATWALWALWAAVLRNIRSYKLRVELHCKWHQPSWSLNYLKTLRAMCWTILWSKMRLDARFVSCSYKVCIWFISSRTTYELASQSFMVTSSTYKPTDQDVQIKVFGLCL